MSWNWSEPTWNSVIFPERLNVLFVVYGLTSDSTLDNWINVFSWLLLSWIRPCVKFSLKFRQPSHCLGLMCEPVLNNRFFLFKPCRLLAGRTWPSSSSITSWIYVMWVNGQLQGWMVPMLSHCTGLKPVFSLDFSLQAIDEGSLDSLDHSDFLDTDIPFEVPIPTKLCVTVRRPSTEHTQTPELTVVGLIDN